MGDALRAQGLDLPEETVFGLGAGLGFSLWSGDTSLAPYFRAHLGVGRNYQDATLFGGLTTREVIQVALSRHHRVGFRAASDQARQGRQPAAGCAAAHRSQPAADRWRCAGSHGRRGTAPPPILLITDIA